MSADSDMLLSLGCLSGVSQTGYFFFLILGMRVNFNNSSHVKKSKSTMSTFLCVQNEKTHKDFPGNPVVKNPI